MSGFPATAALIIFISVIVAILYLLLVRVRVTVPWTSIELHISYCFMPLVGVLLMLACQSVTLKDVGRGLAGDEHIKPYGILILFMALAYIAGSIDMTGLFAWIALKMTTASKGDGKKLVRAAGPPPPPPSPPYPWA